MKWKIIKLQIDHFNDIGNFDVNERQSNLDETCSDTKRFRSWNESGVN